VPHTFSQDSPADRLTQVCRQVHAALEAREPESDTAYATRRAMERLAAGSELLVVLELAHRDLELRKRLRSILVRKWMLRAATDVLGRPPRRRQPHAAGTIARDGTGPAVLVIAAPGVRGRPPGQPTPSHRRERGSSVLASFAVSGAAHERGGAGPVPLDRLLPRLRPLRPRGGDSL
jgi:hypothetical protein